MNTVQLECFVTVAEYLNFSKASQVLKITQPAVTHQIQALEKELGTKLFLRTSKTVTLTREGVQFLGDAQLILKTALSAKERLGNREQYITLVLGCHNHMELSLLPPVLHDLAGEYPLLRPDIRMIPFPSLMGLIENEQVHAALSVKLEQKTSPLFFRELCRVPLACVCAPEHPLASHSTLTASQLNGKFIACSPRQIPDAVFTAQTRILGGLRPEERYFAENTGARRSGILPKIQKAPSLSQRRSWGTRCTPISFPRGTGISAISPLRTCRRSPSACITGMTRTCRR